MLGHHLEHQPLGLFVSSSSGDDPLEVRRVRRVANLVVSFEDDYSAKIGFR